MSRTREARAPRANRPSLAADRKTRLFIDPSLKPEDKEWRWFAETVHNAPNDGRIETALMDGWEPVKAEDYPQLKPPTLPGRAKDEVGVIRKGGQILMQMDKWAYEEKLEQHEAESNRAREAVSTAVEGDGMQPDDRIQVHANQTKMEGRRPIKQ